MPPVSLCKSLLLLLLIACTGQSLKADTTCMKFGTTWKFLDKGVEAPAGWRNIAFNDAGWKTGAASFGYGAGTQRTQVSYGPNAAAKYITTYFRKTVNISGLAAYAAFRLNSYIDDGAVIYVNGKEVARINIKGKPSYATLAASADENGNAITSFDIATSSFVNGKNLIAVELHQNDAASTDLSFDMELVAIPTAGAAEPAVTRGPFLQMGSPDAMTIRWTTASPASSRVKYGADENALTAAITDKKNTTEHEIRVTGLTADTKYYYAIGSASSIVKGSYRNYFITSPPATTKRKIRIGVFGDPGTGTHVQKKSRDNYLLLNGAYNNGEMVIMLGDNAYNAGTEAEHTSRFFNIYDNNIFDNHVIFPVPGNHDYANDRNRAIDHNVPYYNIVTVPTQAESGGLASGTEHYYSYNYGNIHFIMLDSYGIDGGNHLYDDTTNGQQALWLKADLAANAGKHKWTIACMHHPPYTHGSHNSDAEQDLAAIRKKITPILERYGVDVVLAGHSHVYERSFLVKDHTGLSGSFNNGTDTGGTSLSQSSARYDGSKGNKAAADSSVANGSCPYFIIDSVYKHGTVYVVAGSAGQVTGNTANTYPVFYTRNQSTSLGGESGALYLEIQDNRLDAKFVGYSGTIRDQFTIMKGVNKNAQLNAVVNKPVLLNASWIGGYNWQGEAGTPAISQSKQRAISIRLKTTGNYIYYVSDSLQPSHTCITDTFTLRVSSTMAAAVTKYEALLKNKQVLVQWTTGQESNSDYFTIERSSNGQNFETLMAISAKGQSSTASNYEFIDNSVLQGAAWYRLVATDKNNTSNVVGILMVSQPNNQLTGDR